MKHTYKLAIACCCDKLKLNKLYSFSRYYLYNNSRHIKLILMVGVDLGPN